MNKQIHIMDKEKNVMEEITVSDDFWKETIRRARISQAQLKNKIKKGIQQNE